MKKLLPLFLALLLCIPAARAETGVRYIDGANTDRVHLRAAPSQTADSFGLYFTGTDAIVIDQSGDWAYVLIGAAEGWMMKGYLTVDAPAQLGPWAVVDNPHSTWVNLRMSPSLDGMVGMCPDNGTVVHVLGETKDGWSYVECEGVKGYVVTDYLSSEQDAAQRTTVLAQLGEWDDYIHQYIAPNGQAIYFTAARRDPNISFEDVNFDGWDDIVVMTTSGASNAYYVFFVYDTEVDEYRRVSVTGEENGLCNFALYPEYGIVATHANNGNAGLLHVWNLYRWEGSDLRLIRSAVSDEWTEDIFEGSTYTQIIHGDILHVVVRDHTKDYDESVLLELILPKEAAETRDIFTEEMEALWEGIK